MCIIIIITFYCRCVIMVGLPYPNKFSPELKEKMTYLDANMVTCLRYNKNNNNNNNNNKSK